MPLSNLIFDQKDRIGQWVADQVEQTASWGSFYAMGVEQGDEIIAGIVFNNFNAVNATCHIAVTRPGKSFFRLLEHAADYAFNHCKLKRLTGMVPTSKQDVLAFDKHMGWEEEFVMKSAAFDGGDLHVLAMWPDRCRWLKRG